MEAATATTSVPEQSTSSPEAATDPVGSATVPLDPLPPPTGGTNSADDTPTVIEDAEPDAVPSGDEPTAPEDEATDSAGDEPAEDEKVSGEADVGEGQPDDDQDIADADVTSDGPDDDFSAEPGAADANRRDDACSGRRFDVDVDQFGCPIVGPHRGRHGIGDHRTRVHREVNRHVRDVSGQPSHIDHQLSDNRQDPRP